ncbi:MULTISPECIES: exodeoxyribonuclease V subunit alpha [Geobacter]|uniref:exodeoxyribonuclease V subunit alpha n=1 Tax=Geobacter TaxID=28231 RepID=UPI002572FE7E|nr:exodeoxyribonuclease V subunit alpha [Geobacter sulfurreducens]BEH10484.1 exodeoxyribonuclease V subunit alpha [Geobacter sulfurreducens subsp. ethanolicus]BET57928.1 exodeoxyribonuclease V subunit alpha [Geobacter sp. 60473]
MSADDLQFRDIDACFADFLCRLAGGRNDDLHRAAMHASAAVGAGHVCLHLDEAFGSNGAALAATLRALPVVGPPGGRTPLILDERSRLYLYRYWNYEYLVAEFIKQKSAKLRPVSLPLLRAGIDRIFGPKGDDAVDWQRVAAAAAVRSGFCVISGGPGTGKTSTVVSILALLLEQAGEEGTGIALAAPTGKAAARLGDSIRDARQRLAAVTPVAERIPGQVSTIHRLLGVIPGSVRFRHNRHNPLPHRVVVVDEASMVPLPLMARLMEALAPSARLILLGDRDQLASVEAGAVLGDICDTGRAHRFSAPFREFIRDAAGEEIEGEAGGEGNGQPGTPADSLVILRRNYRFGAASAIGAASAAVNEGDGDRLMALVSGEGMDGGVALRPVPPAERLAGALAESVVAGYGEYLRQTDPEQALICFDRFRVLGAVRQGEYGVQGLNRAIERVLARQGLIDADRVWYPGRPVMVTVNDYGLGLFNGDIGLVVADPAFSGGLAVCFPAPGGGVRRLSPARLPAHETVFAMTVHKSQGSEFDRILLVLPPFDSPVLTRELVYTGLTRARTGAVIWADEEILRSAAARRSERRSGLREALWG